MNNIKFILTNKSSNIDNEDYFPLRVVYESSSENLQHIGFYNGDEDLLELSVDKDTKSLQKLQITICHHYLIDDTSFSIESLNTTDEDILFELPDHNECESFYMHVYSNCAVISLSDNKPTNYVMCGQVLFGVNDTHKILSIIVTGLTENDINHIRDELSLQ